MLPTAEPVKLELKVRRPTPVRFVAGMMMLSAACSTSALAHLADSCQILSEVRKVPITPIGAGRLLGIREELSSLAAARFL
jgi:hypothetical protein